MEGRDDWRGRAACRGMATGAFFVPSSDPGAWKAELEPKAVCSSCPAQEDCLGAGALENFGIWGGLTTTERRQARRAARLRGAA
jgi:WhiB family redox-sensing transcriptional regulator